VSGLIQLHKKRMVCSVLWIFILENSAQTLVDVTDGNIDSVICWLLAKFNVDMPLTQPL
jgi:hypothetical protein